MRFTVIKLPALLAFLALAACTSVTVTTDYDHSAPFGRYKTYALEPAVHGQTLSPASAAALRNTLHSELAARGISEAPAGKAELAVVPHVFLDQKVSVQQYTDWGYGYHDDWPYRYGYYGMWAGAPTTYLDVNHYTEGTLILDVVDTHTRKLVFRGTGTAVVGSSEGNADKIRDAVKEMVDALPSGSAH